MKNLLRLAAVLLVFSSAATLTLANKAHKDYGGSVDFCIMLSPNTIVLSSPCDAISVHSNIPYSTVIPDSVAVNEINVSTGADTCGDLVARISVDALAQYLEPGQVITLTLSGLLVNGNEFAASADITVKE